LDWFKPIQASDVVAAVERLFPDVLGDGLTSLTLHGKHAETVATATDERIGILCVLNDPHGLPRLAEVVSKLPGKHLLNPMVMSQEELQASTDVFPITFLEMKRCYRVLSGIDVLDGLTISHAHLRLRCEQELKNLMLRMQNTLLLNHDDSKLLRVTLRRNCRAFLRACNASLLLLDRDIQSTDQATIAEASKVFDLDWQVVEQVANAGRSKATPSSDSTISLYAEFLRVVHQAADVVDRLPEDVTLVEIEAV